MGDEKADILSQRPARTGWARRIIFGTLLLALSPLAVITAFGIAPGTDVEMSDARLIEQRLGELRLPADPPREERYSSQDRVLRGDTVAALFERLGVRDPQALEFLKADSTGRTLFRQLVPGRALQAETGSQGELLSLRYMLSSSSLLEVVRGGDGFTAKQRAVTEEPRRFYKTATIRSSLFAATDSAGIPDAIATQITRVFATDIDFHTDLRKGDRFSVVYDMIYEGGEVVAPGRILAAQFVNDGRVYDAVLFKGEDGEENYYSLDGTNRAKSFMRSPLEFTRISSGFGSRLHPIFKNWRAHTGVDFAAPQGTRVLATADASVVSAGRRGGYGNAIELRHSGGITTLYGHLSAFASGVRAGAHVRQGEVIGYVGMTGFATGPHLHYEFRIAGALQDPMKVALPKAQPVPAQLKPQFMQVAAQARSAIERVSDSTPARFE
ncbi:MAG: peptidoglycan DD-metalloendopeptidase family protein [Betaproteobacteria bacterium]